MFNYFGAKHRLAATYQAPEHDLIVEPFAGAGGYACYWLSRASDTHALLIDSDWLVIEMWNRLLSMDPEELWSYPLPVKGEIITDHVYLAATVSSGSWNAIHNGRPFQVTGWMERDFPMVRERMATTLAVIRGRIEVREGDYRTAPNSAASWFIDPPYQLDGHHYALGNALDFVALGEWCQSRQGQVIVCESDGADWMEFVPHRSNQTSRNTESIEVVWYSHPEPTLFDV